ncbi:MAG TPA: DUF5103 domain-containing protein [Chitinophagaceae bacterium]|nr:DUF5103 domain-containing protein [Chitinophagaceae bacterium]HRF17834.1 DUF5103 domain-containing protein [Chitinophagaceae bacterium]
MIRNSLLLLLLLSFSATAQLPDHVYKSNIKTVKLFKSGDMYSYPVIMLNSNEQLELHFDDMDADVKYYYYSFQLCNADWKPANIQLFDYIRGFTSNRITNYRHSSLAQTRYTHYQAVLPERNGAPSKAGNYLLKVFLNDDTSKLVFTKRMLIVNTKANVSAQVLQPFNTNYFQTHQRVQVNVSTVPGQVNTFSPQDLKVVVLQNNIWNNASLLDRPTVFRGNYYEYSDEENTTFQSGKEWRWIDLRSLRLMSDRMTKIVDNDTTNRVDVYVKPDGERRQQLYIYYRDFNGIYTVENRDNSNALWQSDYAWVHFTYVPPGNRAYEGKSVYLFGELTNYLQDDNSKMIFNEEKGVYERALYLKQGYYNYSYVTLTDKKQPGVQALYENTEGNYWGTENSYMVLVYFRNFGARADELIGFTKINSAFQR